MDRIRKSALLGGSALMVVLSGSSGALAQNCTNFITPIGNLSPFVAGAVSAATSVAASIANVNTAFLTQQGSAFVANPGGAAPGQQGGGVWVRGVGGEVDIKTTSVTTGNFTVPAVPAVNTTGTVTCASKEHETFGGVQVGSDVAKLNLAGWNINLGTTAGYLGSTAKERNGIPPLSETQFQVPFAGVYLVATYGSFFADVMFRGEVYNMELDSPAINFFNQPFRAHGASVSASAGYNFQFGNGWFVEPSVGFTWSRTKVDAFSAVGLPGGLDFSGTVKIDDIDSEIGRATIRVGTSFTAGDTFLQPFVSASVFHEFAGDVTSTYQTCTNCVFFRNAVFPDGTPASINLQQSTSRIGTYGQFSAGLAAQVANTGWVGFVRGDYRTGDKIEGWTANAGLRYNFLPVAAPPPLITKGPALPPVVAGVDGTGFYLGGYFGGGFGRSSITFIGDGMVRPRIAGPTGGGQIGYNWQLGSYVLGIEADGGAADIHGARTCGGATGADAGGHGVAFSPFFLTCESDLDWTASFTGRLGYAWERALFYVKAGGAWTRDQVTIGRIFGPTNGNGINARACFNPANVLTNGSVTSRDDRFGLAAGWGTEFALNANWSAKAELLYKDFGHDTVRTTDGTLLKVDTYVTEVKVGVNYHFNPMSR